MSELTLQCRHRFASSFEIDLDLALEVRFTALFGPSGSGKSSVLSMIAGLLRPDQGKILIAGHTLLDTAAGVCLPPEARRVGIVFQDSLLFPHLTVGDNLRYGQRRRSGARPSFDFGRVVEVLELSHLTKRSTENLSGGERQRVAIGRALLSGPEILLMDEPLASLDAALKARVLGYVERVVEEWQVPTLFVTHAQADVRRAADQVILLEKGRLIASGPPEETLSRPEPLGWADSAGPVNLLRISALETRDGVRMASIGEQELQLPPAMAGAASPSFVQFSPADVVLSREDVRDLSARNHLQGRVRQLRAVDRGLFAAIDVGEILWVILTPQAARELRLEVGSEVVCLLKTHSLSAVE